jgi:tRNA (adenine22-N1)-methyltransferase
MIGEGERVADIGTDHALLPIALFERGVTRTLILSDIRPGPIEKARANIDRRLPGEVLDIRLGGGLAPLAVGEADVVIIAGMGGLLIADILSSDPEKTRSFGRYILQPRNAADKLRIRLAELGFVTFEETLATEGRFICEIICASPGGGLQPEFAPETEGLSAEISPLLIRKGDPLLPELLERKIKAADAVSERLTNAGAGKEQLLKRSEKRAADLRALLGSLESDGGNDGLPTVTENTYAY